MGLDCVSNQFLIAALTISVRAVEKIYADLARAAQGLDRRISVGLIVERRHRRAAETDRGNLKPAESPPLHPFCLLKPSVPLWEKPTPHKSSVVGTNVSGTNLEVGPQVRI